VVATDLAVWVFAYGGTEDGSLGTLLRLDPATGNTVKTMVLNDVVPATVGHDPIVYATSADEDALWILTAEVAGGELGKITLVRLDASSYQTRVFDPGRVAAFAVGGGAIWLPAAHGAIRLDQESGNETRVEVPGAHPWPFAVSGDSAWFVAGTATEIELVRLDVDGEGIKVGLDVPVPRQSSWGSVDASYDGDGSVWLLYETGRLQKVSVGSVP
jgi:hypothetical protein